MQRRIDLCEWFQAFPGQPLLAVETDAVRNVWPSLFGRTVIQLGSVGDHNLFEGCNAPVRALLEYARVPVPDVPCLHAQPDALPFDQRSVDIALLPHTLEFADDPHQVLREVSRVLAPEGHVVILGFNPISFWGLRRLLTRRHRTVPWSGNFMKLARLKDWLKLLEFDLVQGSMHFYRPPLTSVRAMDRLRFLDKAGNRWWPMAGGVYLLVARKRVAGMTALRPEWRRPRSFGTAVARPALRVIRGGIMRGG